MKISTYVTAAAIFCFCSFSARADQCESWEHKGYPVSMAACSYPNGGSGYYKITNDGAQAASVCWTVVYNDGRTSKGCNSNLQAGESSKGSCFSCGMKNGGARHILLNSYKPK